jgi:hypothetical protein
LHEEVLEDGGLVAILTPDLPLFPILDRRKLLSSKGFSVQQRLELPDRRDHGPLLLHLDLWVERPAAR